MKGKYGKARYALVKYIDVFPVDRKKRFAHNVVFRPKDKKDQLDLEEYARQINKKNVRILCPFCVQTYYALGGHVGSDWCMVETNILREQELGNIIISRNYTQFLIDAGIKFHIGPGATRLLNYIEIKKFGKVYRGVAADDRMFAPRWVDRILAASKEVRARASKKLARPKRIEALITVRDSPELQETVMSLNTTWEINVLRQWLLKYADMVICEEVRDILLEHHEDLIVDLAKIQLLRQEASWQRL